MFRFVSVYSAALTILLAAASSSRADLVEAIPKNCDEVHQLFKHDTPLRKDIVATMKLIQAYEKFSQNIHPAPSQLCDLVYEVQRFSVGTQKTLKVCASNQDTRLSLLKAYRELLNDYIDLEHVMQGQLDAYECQK